MDLDLCPSCNRHVRARERACPFCGVARRPTAPSNPAARAFVRAAWMVCCAGVALAGCEVAEAQPRPTRRRPARDAGAPRATPPAPATRDAGAVAPTAGVTVGACSVEGADTSYRLRVENLLRARSRQLADCYAPVLRAHPTVDGSVEARVTVGSGGTVTEAAVNGMRGFPELGACVERAFRAVTFPAPAAGPVAVSVPLRFAPAVGEGAAVAPVEPPGPYPSRERRRYDELIRNNTMLYGMRL